MRVRLEHSVSFSSAAAAAPSQRVLQTAALFGLALDHQPPLRILPPIELPLEPGTIVFITGPSGSGKSTLLRLIARQCAQASVRVLHMHGGPADGGDDQAIVVDSLGRDAAHAHALLAMAGLSDAFIMLRRAAELSDGQRFRLRLAQLIDQAGEPARAAAAASVPGAVVLIDEFAATLDRLTAHNIALSVRRWVSRTTICLVCATTHDDILEALAPDALVCKGLGDRIEVATR